MVEPLETTPAQDEHYEELYALHVASMRGYVTATYGWDEEVQRRLFAEDWPRNAPALRLVRREGQIVAAYRIVRRLDELHLASIEVHPRFQGQGLGGAILAQLLAEARWLGVPATLAVMKANPRARALYERLGFRATRETPTHFFMSS